MGSNLVFNDAHKPANRAILFNDQGKIVAWYDKIHLFGLMAEDQYLASGNKLTLAPNALGTSRVSYLL